MDWKSLIAGCGGVGAIVGLVFWAFRYSAWALKKTPEEKKENIDAEIDSEEERVKKTGRPE